MHGGAECPCCHQNAKVYRRPLNARQGRVLIAMHQQVGSEWCHLPDIEAPLRLGGSETAKARYWGLLVSREDEREDGGKAGTWKLTGKGVMFVLGTVLVPKYSLIYNKRCLGLQGESVSIHDVLGEKFSYRELMMS